MSCGQDQRGRFESEWNELSAQLPGKANIDSALLAIYRQRLELLEREIKTFSNKIGQLNAVGQEAVSAGVRQVLEIERQRLWEVFNQASAAYLAETARLTEVCKIEIEHLWAGAVPATASLSLAQSSVEAACNRLTHFTKLCQERRARFESEWTELSKQPSLRRRYRVHAILHASAAPRAA